MREELIKFLYPNSGRNKESKKVLFVPKNIYNITKGLKYVQLFAIAILVKMTVVN